MKLQWLTNWRSLPFQIELKRIWLDCYEDSEEYVDFFFANVPDRMQVIGAFEGEKLIGGVYLFPCQVTGGKAADITGDRYEKRNAYYLYAGGVLSSYRRNHVYESICREIRSKLQKEDAGLLCYAKPCLRGFYEKMGLSCYYESIEMKWERQKNEEGKEKYRCFREEIGAEELYQLRRQHFFKNAFLLWDREQLDYIVKEKKFCGGFADFFIVNRQKYVIIGEVKKGVLWIEETTMTPEELRRYGDDILSFYEAECLTVRFPVWETLSHSVQRVYSGMGNIAAKELWVSFTLL